MNALFMRVETNFATRVFGPVLKPVFLPVNAALDGVYMPWARIAAVGLFVLAIVWVLSLRKEYVNLDAPRKAWYADLRVWTIVALLPHFYVYLFL